MAANERQVGGAHYAGGIQHWDFVVAQRLNYFEGQITKYVARCRKKNGIEDLKKAQHFLEKYLEVYESLGDFKVPQMRLEGVEDGSVIARRLQDALGPLPALTPGPASAGTSTGQ